MFTDSALKKVSALLKNFEQSDERYHVTVRSWEDFERIPVSSRQVLKNFSDNKVIHHAFNIASTSGSTATRMMFAQSKEAYEAHKKRLVALYQQFGIKEGVVCLNLCSYDLNSGGRLMDVGFKAAGAGVIPLGPISSPAKILEAVQLIEKFKPTVINTYTNQMFDLFSALGPNHSIEKCMVTGEILWPEYRRRMEALGGVRIYDHYGVMEFSGLSVATDPEDEYMKLFADGLLLEVLDESGNVSRTGVGSLLVTDLDNTCMPFIRYHLGDRVDLIERQGELWIKVLGRTDESLSINGVVAFKKELICAVNNYIGHPNFFFLLDKNKTNYEDRLIINVAGDSAKDINLLPKIIVKALGLDHCIVVRNHQGNIPKTPNGKIKYFVSTQK